MNKNRAKILIHISAISLFLSGLIIIHAIINSVMVAPDIRFVDFFGIYINKSFTLDFSIIIMGFSFFIEFFMTFRPVHLK